VLNDRIRTNIFPQKEYQVSSTKRGIPPGMTAFCGVLFDSAHILPQYPPGNGYA
jgi:hypothetical protein